MTLDPGDATIETYGRIIASYTARTRLRPPAVVAHLDRLAALVPGGTVLEIGSGPGFDAELLEERGMTVQRTDATPAFVERLRVAGRDARLLDVRRDSTLSALCRVALLKAPRVG